MSAIPHPGARPDCPRCAGTSYVVRRNGEHATASVCDCVVACPVCDGSDWVPAGDDWRAPRKRCTCQSIHRRIDLFNNARIPGRHSDSTLENFEYTGHQDLARAWMGARTVVTTWDPEKECRGFVLWGPVGTGKTHLMVGVLRALVFQHGVAVRFAEFSHLLADLKAGFEQGSGASTLVQELVDVQVLAIDELGKGRNTEWEGTVLDELISRRYNAAATVLATTNYPPERTGHATPNLASPRNTTPGLADRIPERVYSRLFDLCEFFGMPGEDWRRRRSAPARQRG